MATADAPAIVWLRQDLRLTDNPALHAAVAIRTADATVLAAAAAEFAKTYPGPIVDHAGARRRAFDAFAAL